ncbi:MAG: hypothetical protein EXS24_02015 [Pedosphaera sp.]|nr:hypothetical protein [Pedosphaera sp.]
MGLLAFIAILGGIDLLFATPAQIAERSGIRWDWRRGLPVAVGNPSSPVSVWAPTNLVTYTTNRAVFPETVRVLILGDGVTGEGINYLADVLTQMSTRGKFKIKATSRASGVYTLFNHYTDMQSRTLINATIPDRTNPTNRLCWDAVVLQESRQIPVYAFGQFRNSVTNLNQAVLDAQSQTALFMTWGIGDEFFSASEFLDRTEFAHQNVGQLASIPYFPVGRAWDLCEKRRPQIKLRQRDRFTPTPHGMYLNACVLYAYLTWQSPLGLTDGGLHMIAEDELIFMQKLAWELFEANPNGISF